MSASSHVCLVGPLLCRNQRLVEGLSGQHRLTLLEDMDVHNVERLQVFDVVALDCRQFGASGAMALVRALRSIADVPIVVLDGALGRADVARLFNAGAQDYFSEPFNEALIAERLAHLADSNRAVRRLTAEESQ